VAYVQFVERVIAQKRKDPKTIQGTVRYLERIRDFGSFDCRPTGMLVVDPHGRILNPCEYKYPALCDHIGKIATQRDALNVLHAALNYNARFRPCQKLCLKACFVEPSLSVQAPLELAAEFVLPNWLRSFIST